MRSFVILALAAAAIAAPARVFTTNYGVPPGAEGETAAAVKARVATPAHVFTTNYDVPPGAEGETAVAVKAREVEVAPKEKSAFMLYAVPAGAEGETAQ